MIIIWSIFWGAVLGWCWPGSDDFGVFLGGFLGLFAGLSLRWAVRAEVEAVRSEADTEIAREKLTLQMATVSAPHPSAMSKSSIQAVEDGGGFKNSENTAAVSPEPLSAQSAPVAPQVLAPVSASAGVLSAVSNEEVSLDIPNGLSREQATSAKRPVYVSAQPNAIELALIAGKNWFLGGNTIVRAGLVILFIGLSFLARYAASAGLLPVEFRLTAIAAAAIALLVVGFRKRTEKPDFALALQGAGVGVIYLTVFAAFSIYDLLLALPAFGLMIVVCTLSCALALLQNSRALAVAAFAGGFAVPILLSTGQGSHVSLFSYYLVLNLAILFIAYRRSWRILNVVGFIATFGVATAWGVLKYTPEHYASTQPFLIGFLLIYLFAAILFARNTPTQLGNAVDTMLVFGTPLAGFGLQAGLVRTMELGTAFSALGFAALYLVTAMVLVRRALSSYRLLIECFIAVGVGFATLAVPLALDARWTSAVWALEGVGAFWVGKRQARWMPRAFGLLLQGVAAVAFLGSVGNNISSVPLANPVFIGAMLIALPAFTLAWWLRQPLPHSGSSWARSYAKTEAMLSSPIYLYGFVFWCLALVFEITRRAPGNELGLMPVPLFSQSTVQMLTMLAMIGSAALSMVLGLKVRWPVATWPSRLAVIIMALGFFEQATMGYRALHMPAWAVWPLMLLLHYWMLRQSDRLAASVVEPDVLLRSPRYRILHAGTVWLITLLLADCLWFGIARAELWSTSWAGVVLLVSATAVLMALALWAGRANRLAGRQAFGWPLNPHAEAYYWHAALPLAMLMFWGTLLAAVHSSGHTAPLPYIPLLNPTDLTLALSLCALLFWRRGLSAAAPAPASAGWVTGRNTLVALTLLMFVAINTVWLRIAHHFFGVSWNAGALFESFVVQTGYAILWTLLALSIMVLAHRRVQRSLWLVGAGLLCLVIVKLLLLDLTNAGGAERIIAFIVVGVLMLVVGYFAPLPPKTVADTAKDELLRDTNDLNTTQP